MRRLQRSSHQELGKCPGKYCGFYFPFFIVENISRRYLKINVDFKLINYTITLSLSTSYYFINKIICLTNIR